MANVKITQLPSATTPLTGTEVFPLVQGTTTKQVSITGLFTSPVMTNPTLGTVGQADLINATGLPISTGVAGLGTGIATFLGTPSSANLRAAVTDETGTGSLVFATSPTLVTPNLGTPSVLVATNATGTAVGLTAGSAITNANLTGAVTSVGNATSLGSFTSAQLRTALTDETGAGSAVFATSPTITAPILNQINDTNNAQILGLSPTTSAVDYLVVKNGIGVGVPLHFYADGSSANIGLHIQPKGTGLVTISDGTDFNKGIRFRSSSSAASAVTLLDAVSTAGRVVTLPDATTTLVGRDTTDTLTNKTIAFSSNTFSGTLAIANGGTNASTAALAIENLLPAYAGNGSKGLRLNSGATALEWVADGGGTVTSVAASVPSFLSIAGSPITTSGTLAISLSGTALPTTSGGTGLTSFTSSGVVYASSTSALATGSALTFDGTTVLSIETGSGVYQSRDNATFRAYAGGTNSTVVDINSAGTVGITKFSINNTEALRLTSTSLYTASGINVGIGTSSPANKLTIGGTDTSVFFKNAGATTGYAATQIVNTGGSFYMGVTSSTGVFWQNTSGNYAATIGTSNATNLTFATNDNIRATLDSAGNLGLGVTPSAWSDGPVMQVGGIGIASRTALPSLLQLSANQYWDGANHRYIASNYATIYSQHLGGHIWSSAASGTAGAIATFTAAMTLDASGNLGLGSTSPQSQAGFGALTLNGSTGGALFLTTGNTRTAQFYNTSTAASIGSVTAIPLTFLTTDTERARIDSSGNFGIGSSSPDFASSGDKVLNVTGSSVRGSLLLVNSSTGTTGVAGSIKSYNGSTFLTSIDFEAAGATNSGSMVFYTANGGTTADRMRLSSAGIVTMTAYGAGAATFSAAGVISSVSDETWKRKDGVPTNPDVMLQKLEPCYWFYNEEKAPIFGQERQLGFFAQNVNAAIGPEAAPEPEEGKPWGYYDRSVLAVTVMSLQKALVTIESLKARLDAANL